MTLPRVASAMPWDASVLLYDCPEGGMVKVKGMKRAYMKALRDRFYFGAYISANMSTSGVTALGV